MNHPTNAELITAVRAWQDNPVVHPLTCGNDSSHRKLEPVEEDNRVVLRCPDCTYCQPSIPRVILPNQD